MDKRKMVVSDYDGTFYLNEKGIVENINKINKFREKDNLFVIATGNNWRHFKKVVEKYNINYDYLILDQGACIVDNQDNLLKASCMDYNICKKLIKEISIINKKYKLCSPYEEIETIEENSITKISLDFVDLQEALDFTKNINKKYGEYVNAYTMIFEEINIVEIVSSETDKNQSIKFIINKEKILKSDVYTIGNGYNDISMIQNFNGYCMKNSVNELLEVCKNQVETVAELIDSISNT